MLYNLLYQEGLDDHVIGSVVNNMIDEPAD